MSERRGFFSRLSGIGGVRRMSGVAKDGADFVADSASTLKPRRFDRRGFFGRDHDGGIARFRQMSANLSAADIQNAHTGWSNQKQVFAAMGVACLIMIPLGFVGGFMTWYFLIGLLGAAVLFGTRTLVADFRAWQIEQGRFAPPAEYLNDRLPRNMQIIEKD